MRPVELLHDFLDVVNLQVIDLVRPGLVAQSPLGIPIAGSGT
jgi:hypothetical protein